MIRRIALLLIALLPATSHAQCSGGTCSVRQSIVVREAPRILPVARIVQTVKTPCPAPVECCEPVAQPSCGCAPVQGCGAVGGGFQAQAQWEAQEMARRGYKGHIRGKIPGVGFCGVGWSSSGMPSTCTPSRGMTLVADAVAHSRYGTFRVRYWQ